MMIYIFVSMCVTGRMPTLSRGTLVTVPLVDKSQNKGWEAKIIEQKDTRMKLSVSTLPTAPIGRYGLSVITWTPEGSNTYSHKPKNDIYMLFNPWCKGKRGQKYDEITTSVSFGVTALFACLSPSDDSVFMDNEAERKEYVLNDVGILYYGNENQIGSRTWIFGQV